MAIFLKSGWLNHQLVFSTYNVGKSITLLVIDNPHFRKIIGEWSALLSRHNYSYYIYVIYVCIYIYIYTLPNMYGVFAYICLFCVVNVGRYRIHAHGPYGIYKPCKSTIIKIIVPPTCWLQNHYCLDVPVS